MRGKLEGDKLASGAPRATFMGPMMKFNELQMRQDLTVLPMQTFCEKYLITMREYEMLARSDNEQAVNAFAEQMKRQAEFYQRGLDSDAAQADSLKRDCPLELCYMPGCGGKVLVSRDEPATPSGERGRLLIPRSMRKEKVLLPTVGEIIKAVVFDAEGRDISKQFIGRRILFQQMSGSAVCFNMYPTWQLLDLAEIMAWVVDDKASVVEEQLESMV